MKITVLGAGAWGTALASHAAKRHDTLLWARDANSISALKRQGENARYLPGIPLTTTLRYEADLVSSLKHVMSDDDLCVLATPVSGLRGLCKAIRASLCVPSHVIWLCKGFEAGTSDLPHRVVQATLGIRNSGVLSGPSFAKEVARGLPVALTVASTSAACRERVVEAFHHAAMRLYTAEDVIGVEVGGAVKNILAIAAGISDGLGMGLNARAALLTRGLAEMTRLGVTLGADSKTFQGLAGLGDLILTATGDLSRNRTVGLEIAQGRTLDQILSKLGHVAEGVCCLQTVLALAAVHRVDMPITQAVNDVLFNNCLPHEAVDSLLGRAMRAE
jgi:glycerol-3-phosphate dehydrogenase (NAD(P)+)